MDKLIKAAKEGRLIKGDLTRDKKKKSEVC